MQQVNMTSDSGTTSTPFNLSPSFDSGATSTPFNLSPSFDERRWVIQIRKTLDDEGLEDDTGIPVSIFSVPKTLMATNPEAYTPQEVAIGPYHHWRPELYEMERHKLSAARRVQKQLQSLKLQQVVDEIVRHEDRIRSQYHRYLDFNGETLAWMMAVDASFLLEFLQIFSLKEGKITTGASSSRMSHIVEYAGSKSAQNAILRDILMLENQIPLFLLGKILQLQFSSSQESDEMLSMILLSFMKEISPFTMEENFSLIKVQGHSHLLELLYYMLVPKSEDRSEIHEQDHEIKTTGATDEESLADLSLFRQLLRVIWSMGSSLKGRPFRYLRRAFVSRPVKFVRKLPWTIFSKVPGFPILKLPVESLFSTDEGNVKSENGSSCGNNTNRPPLVEEIAIPSVSELVSTGVKFKATSKGNIKTVAFDKKTITFSLPAVSLDVNTEAIMRNLVAYETLALRGPFVFTRYTELMNGIIDTEDDVKLLRKMGIVLNCLKTDGEVARVWNGTTKSVNLTKVPSLDKVIEDVNRYYSSRWRVKVGKFMKSYIFGSWKFLTLLASILLLLLTTLQAFCSVYSCASFFNVTASSM